MRAPPRSPSPPRRSGVTRAGAVRRVPPLMRADTTAKLARMATDRRFATRYPSEFAERSDWGYRERSLLALALSQHGVVSVSQLRELGFSVSGGRSRDASGR